LAFGGNPVRPRTHAPSVSLGAFSVGSSPLSCFVICFSLDAFHEL
jgi:hypothetical protein